MNVLGAADRLRYQAATELLFAYLTERGIRRTWLARRLGCSRQLIYWYEHRGEMPLARFEEACRALDVTPEKFGWHRVTTRAPRGVKRAS